MDYIFDDWKQILNDFQSSVEKDLACALRSRDHHRSCG